MTPITRAASTIIALSAWLGLVLPFRDFLLSTDNALTAIWEMLAYFTFTTNLLVAIAFTAVALNYPVAPWLIGGVMLSIVLVGVIYALLLRDIPLADTRYAALANTLVHRITPALVILFWIGCVPKRTLHWTDATYWVAYPFGYTCYAILRGSLSGFYPYLFLDLDKIGWRATIRNAAGIALCFIAASLILIGIDHLSRQTT